MYISKWDQLIHISIQNKISTCAFDVILYTAGNRVESPCHFDCFLSQLVEIYGNFNRSHLIINERPLATPGQPFSREGYISSIAPKAVFRICVDHIQQWVLATCKLLSQICENQIGNHANQYPTSNYWKYARFSIWDDHMKRRPCLSQNIERVLVSINVWYQGEYDRAN